MPAPVSVHTGTPPEGWTVMQDFASGTAVVYTGLAKSTQPSYQFTVTSVSTAAAAVVTITAHGLQSDNTVVISGATGDWAAMNGVQIVTVTGADTFTVAVDSSTFADSFDGVVTTTAPRTGASCWAVSKNYYDATGLIRTANASGNSVADKVWNNRASLSYS